MQRFFLTIIILFCFGIGYSQEEMVTFEDPLLEEKTGFDWSKVTVGGNLGLSFGNVTLIDVSPNVGYFVTDNFVLGTGGTYTYYRDNRSKYQTHVYGARVYGQYLIKDWPVILHAEPEWINYYVATLNDRVDVLNMFVGGGLKQSLGQRSYFMLMLLWNLNESNYSYQSNPVFRGGVAIGL